MAAAQCTCEEKFNFVKRELETNYAGYRDKVSENEQNRKTYEELLRNYQARARKTTRSLYCYMLLREWLAFFRDGHLQLRNNEPRVSQEDTLAINELIRKTETIHLTDKELEDLRHKKSSDLEGIYILRKDTMYTVALVANKNEFRDYAAVIVDSKTPYWKKGQVKFEMRKPDSGTVYRTIVYNWAHQGNGALYATGEMWLDGQVWIKPGYRMPEMNETAPGDFTYKKADARKLSDSTLYIQIGTFSGDNAGRIDSLIKAHEKELRSMPNLVLDLRYNGGGADGSYQPLLPYLYTQPVASDGNEIKSTPDNVRRVLAYLEDESATAEDTLWATELARKMENAPGMFVEYSPTDTTVMEQTTLYPKKVAILVNKNCASSTEQFLLFAKESKKVTVMGKPTYGELDYSNVLQAESPCPDITFGYSSTRSYRVDKGTGIDNIGILPAVKLTDGQNWIEEARKYLERK